MESCLFFLAHPVRRGSQSLRRITLEGAIMQWGASTITLIIKKASSITAGSFLYFYHHHVPTIGLPPCAQTYVAICGPSMRTHPTIPRMSNGFPVKGIRA